MRKLKNFLKAAEIAAGTGMFLLDQANRYTPRSVRSKLSDSVDDLRDRAKDAYDMVAERVSSATRRNDEHEGLWNVVRFAAGVGIGIGIGMLMAPDTGEQTRSRIAEKAQEIGGNVRQKFNQEARRYNQEGLRATGTGD
jgi:ElaB/YqjD/DUF883 family membrane-anchored ribosome-binding protein